MLSAIVLGKSQGSFPNGSAPAGKILRGRLSRLSSAYIRSARPICLRLFMQLARLAFSLAVASAGNSIAARMAMMAMTTRSSIKVKPAEHALVFSICPFIPNVFVAARFQSANRDDNQTQRLTGASNQRMQLELTD